MVAIETSCNLGYMMHLAFKKLVDMEPVAVSLIHPHMVATKNTLSDPSLYSVQPERAHLICTCHSAHNWLESTHTKLYPSGNIIIGQILARYRFYHLRNSRREHSIKGDSANSSLLQILQHLKQ